MTEASNLPEREPDNSQGGEAARVTHIKSRRFSPRPSVEVNPGILTPASSRVEPLIVPPILPETEIVPQYLPQEPSLTHKEDRGIPLKAKLAGAAATLAVTAAGVFGYNKINSSSEDEANIAIPPAPTQVIPTPENPQPTVEATKVPEKSPYEFSWEKKFGDVTVRIEDKLQTRTECPDPSVSSKSATMVACPAMHEITLNNDKIPDAEQRLTNGITYGLYNAWKSADESRKSISLETYKEKLNKGEDLSFTARGFQGRSFLPTDIKVNPTDEIYIDWLAQPASIIRPYTTAGYGYRKVNNEFHVEIYDFTAAGMGDMNPVHGIPQNSAASFSVGTAIAFLSNYNLQLNGVHNQQDINQITPLAIELRNYFTKQETPIIFTGVLGVR